MLLDLINKRYSCRDFSNKEIEEEKINLLLRAAQLAPSARNAQAIRLYVLRSKEAMEMLYECDTFNFNSRCAILVGFEEKEVYQNPFHQEINSGEVDAAIAATHIMLEAADLEIASCWIGRFDYLELKTKFNLPASVKIVCSILLGYPSEKGIPSERHYKRKELKEIVKYL